MVVFSQFLRRLQVNFCVRTEGRWEERGFPFFGVFAVSHLTRSQAHPRFTSCRPAAQCWAKGVTTCVTKPRVRHSTAVLRTVQLSSQLGFGSASALVIDSRTVCSLAMMFLWHAKFCHTSRDWLSQADIQRMQMQALCVRFHADGGR